MSEWSAILMSYKRKPNMPEIITSLRMQSIPPNEILLINNDGYDSFGADKVIAIPWNAGEMARYLWTRRVKGPYVMFQDDDFMLGDNKFMEDAIRVLEKRAPNACVGTGGRQVYPEPKHYRHEAKGHTNFLKGHFQVVHQRSLKPLHVCYHPFASDIWYSLDISGGANVHWVDANLKSRLKRIDTHGVGLEFRQGHWAEREQACADYIAEYGFREA